ncbi:reverse transcriptase domain-containing protein [Tanacetum coccineum]
MPPWKAPRTRTTPATTTNTTSVTNAQLQAMIDQGVTAALAARDANRSTNGEDSHNSGTGVRRTERVARECTYQDFMKCQPLFFKGTEGVVKLTQWFERMETVFRISNCTVENQIKFSTCTLLGVALTWWNSHVRTVGHDVAYAMTWTDLKKKMTDKYCPRSEIKKLEVELWNLKVKGTDVLGYNQRFQELALLCVRMFSEESDRIEKYVGGSTDNPPRDKCGSSLRRCDLGERKELCLNSSIVQQVQAAPQWAMYCKEEEKPSQGPNEQEDEYQYHLRKEKYALAKLGKLNPKYVGPSKVMEKVRSVAYKLKFPQELSKIMPPRKAPRTRTTPATTTNTIKKHLSLSPTSGKDWTKAFTAAIAARDAEQKHEFGEDIYNSGNGFKRTDALLREALNQDFMKAEDEIEETRGDSEFEDLERLEKYVGVLADMIHECMASRPKTIIDAIEMATELMDKRSALLLNVKLRIRENLITTTKLNNNILRDKMWLKLRRWDWNPGHDKSDCLELKNQNHGNQAEGIGARGLVHALGGGEADQDLNAMRQSRAEAQIP